MKEEIQIYNNFCIIVMMGAAKVTKGKLSSLYCNQAAADFCQVTKREMMGEIDKITFYSGELEGAFTDRYKVIFYL